MNWTLLCLDFIEIKSMLAIMVMMLHNCYRFWLKWWTCLSIKLLNKLSCTHTSMTSSMVRHPSSRWPALSTSVFDVTSGSSLSYTSRGQPLSSLRWCSGDLGAMIDTDKGLVFPPPGSDRDDRTCSSGLVGLNPGLCCMPSSGDRASCILPCPGSPVHDSSPSSDDSPERSLYMRVDCPSKLISLSSPVIR